MKNKIIIPLANCPAIKGFKRSIIYDLTRENFSFIPNNLYDILLKYKFKTIEELTSDYNHSIDCINEYIQFLLEKEFIYLGDIYEKKYFPEIDFNYESPYKIINSIICVSSYTINFLNSIFTQLEELNCKNIQLIFYYKIELEKIINILESINTSIFHSIELILTNPDYNENSLIEILNHFPRIKSIIAFNSPVYKIISNKKIEQGVLAYYKDDINFDIKHLNNNIKYYFTVNMNSFIEAKHYNLYYNKKVCIDSSGNLKNCLSNIDIFGNINKDKIGEIIKDKKFTSLWNIKKDNIKVCQDCEFRYMCNDPKIPKKYKTNIWEYKLECKYNPYLAKWNGEQGYLSIAQMNEK